MTRERVKLPKEQNTSMGRDLGDLFRNGPWIVLCIVGICANTWAVLKMASLVYFFKYFIGNEAGVAQFMFWGTVGNIAGVFATGWMTKYLGKKNLYIVSMIVNAVTTAAYFFAGSTDMVFLYTMNIIGGFASGPVSPLIWALYADTADYSSGRPDVAPLASSFLPAPSPRRWDGQLVGRWPPTSSPSTDSRPTSFRARAHSSGFASL